jgi:hypothetical protein
MNRTWKFSIPDLADYDVRRRIERAALVGADDMPWPTDLRVADAHVEASRAVFESPRLRLPWPVEDSVELARGEINKAREHLANWEASGLKPTSGVREMLQHATKEFLHALRATDERASADAAQNALASALWCEDLLADEFARQAVASRRGRTGLKVRVGCVYDDRFPTIVNHAALRKVFDHVSIPLDWRRLEPTSGERDWSALEERVEWCLDRGLAVTIGPLVEFRPERLPNWLLEYRDHEFVGMLMVDVVESCVHRFQDRVRSWEVASRANSAAALGLDDFQRLQLCLRLLRAVREQDEQARCSVTLDDPWGDRLRDGRVKLSPVDFLDRLLRSDVPISAVGLEVAVGVGPGGSAARSPLDYCGLIDRYAQLGPPLHLRLHHPAGPTGTEDAQSNWLETHVMLGLAKPAVELVEWGALHDRPENAWPNCGLFDAERRPKRALRRLRAIRRACFR